MNNFKGKAIYQPKGKAAEYSTWACNFYVGCSHGCTYCYLKKGRGAAILGGSTPKLKACFKNWNDAFNVFEKELNQNIDELRKHGLFFSFTTDPMLPETRELTYVASALAVSKGVPVKILTKCVGWEQVYFDCIRDFEGVENQELYAFGFTLTGHDELEPNASTNAERIEAMRKLHEAGFKTFASIEPVIEFSDSYYIMRDSHDYCDLFKIGLESGEKYTPQEVKYFIKEITENCDKAIYFKDSLLKKAGVLRNGLPKNCVDTSFNLFTQSNI